jgi:hypothetical protein
LKQASPPLRGLFWNQCIECRQLWRGILQFQIHFFPSLAILFSKKWFTEGLHFIAQTTSNSKKKVGLCSLVIKQAFPIVVDLLNR